MSYSALLKSMCKKISGENIAWNEYFRYLNMGFENSPLKNVREIKNYFLYINTYIYIYKYIYIYVVEHCEKNLEY